MRLARLRMWAIVVGPAVVLAACGTTPPPIASTVPTTATERASPSPRVVPIEPSPGDPAACRASALRSRAGVQGETGVGHIDVLLTNVGGAPCSLTGAPIDVKLIGSDTRPLMTDLLAPVPTPAHVVVLGPGVADAGWLIVYWTNWCGPGPGQLQISITLAGESGTIHAPVLGSFVARCDAAGAPSTLQTEDFLPNSP